MCIPRAIIIMSRCKNGEDRNRNNGIKELSIALIMISMAKERFPLPIILLKVMSIIITSTKTSTDTTYTITMPIKKVTLHDFDYVHDHSIPSDHFHNPNLLREHGSSELEDANDLAFPCRRMLL